MRTADDCQIRPARGGDQATCSGAAPRAVRGVVRPLHVGVGVWNLRGSRCLSGSSTSVGSDASSRLAESRPTWRSWGAERDESPPHDRGCQSVAPSADEVIDLLHWGCGKSFCLCILLECGQKQVNRLSLVGHRGWVGNKLVQRAIGGFVCAVLAERGKIAFFVGKVSQ